MRKSRKEAAETRERIVESASQEFRRNGIDGTGLSELMAAAGLTHGGFYKHFASKEQVVAESVSCGIHSLLDLWKGTLSTEPPDKGLQSAITTYLSTGHREDVACGCPFAALASDIARSGDSVREAATTGFIAIVDAIAGQFTDLSRAAARKEALWIFTSMMGAVMMARLVTQPTLSDSILREARKHLLIAS